MIIYNGPKRLVVGGSKVYRANGNYDPIYYLDMQWKGDQFWGGGDWQSTDSIVLDRKQALRLQEDIRQWLKENPE